MGKLDGKVAIVTGSGQGVGEAIAVKFAEEGAKIVLATRTVSKAERVQKKIEAAGGKARAISCDVGIKEQVSDVVKFTMDTYGKIDVLVNNAQAIVAEIPLMETSDEDMNISLESGLYGTFWMMKACFPELKKNAGYIVNLCAGSGTKGMANMSAYAAAKEAIRALSKVAANEWGEYGINVNSLAPAALTKDYEKMYADPENAHYNFLHELDKTIPLRRWGKLEEIAKVALFLACSDSSYITGYTLWADGGMCLDCSR